MVEIVFDRDERPFVVDGEELTFLSECCEAALESVMVADREERIYYEAMVCSKCRQEQAVSPGQTPNADMDYVRFWRRYADAEDAAE